MDSPFYISAMHSGSKCVDKQILYEIRKEVKRYEKAR